jgi:cysteine-S-conjugate beta-lyase
MDTSGDSLTMIYDFDTVHDRRASECAKWYAYDSDILPLFVADMDFLSPQPVMEALHQRVHHGIFGYPEWNTSRSSLYQGLYDVIVERMARLYGWIIQPEDIVFYPGVVAGLNVVCSLLAGADQGVLVQPPVYPPFLSLAENAGALPQEAALSRTESGSYEVDWEIFESAITPQTRVFVLCNPHNPVGRVFRRPELEKMAQICLAQNVTIVSDEIHCDLLYPGYRHIPIASLAPEVARHTITLMAPSKTFNLAGLYTSFAIIPDADLRRRFVQLQHARTGGVNVLGLVAAEAAYREGQEWLDQLLIYLKQNRDFVAEFVHRQMPGVQMKVPEATFLAWLDCREAGLQQDVYSFFLKNGRVALNDGRTFGAGGEGFVRLNFGCPRSVLAEALERMQIALQSAR